jgi:hypothetical protein
MVAKMTAIIREYGLERLDGARAHAHDRRERAEASGKRWTLVNNDCVDETRRWPPTASG